MVSNGRESFINLELILIDNIQTINRLSEPPRNIDIIETGWGNRYIALEDVHKLLDDRFEEHQFYLEK